MAIYMKFGDHKGAVTTAGFEGYSECMSFSWGVARQMVTAGSGSKNRETGQVAVQDINITKMMDTASTKLLHEAWGGKLATKVLIKFATMKETGVEDYLTYELLNTAISSYSLSGHNEDQPMESLSLNFTKITQTFKTFDEKHVGTPAVVNYDLETRKAG